MIKRAYSSGSALILQQFGYSATYSLVLVQSVPRLSGNGKGQQESSLNDLGEVHLEVFLRNTEESEETLSVLEILSGVWIKKI